MTDPDESTWVEQADALFAALQVWIVNDKAKAIAEAYARGVRDGRSLPEPGVPSVNELEDIAYNRGVAEVRRERDELAEALQGLLDGLPLNPPGVRWLGEERARVALAKTKRSKPSSPHQQPKKRETDRDR